MRQSLVFPRWCIRWWVFGACWKEGCLLHGGLRALCRGMVFVSDCDHRSREAFSTAKRLGLMLAEVTTSCLWRFSIVFPAGG